MPPSRVHSHRLSAHRSRPAAVRALALAVPLLMLAPNARSNVPADLVLVHGTILTVDAQDSVAQALAVRGGKIVAIGTDQDILRLAGARTRRIDLHGRTATPGLIDSHAHIADGGVAELYHVRLSDVTTVAEAVRRVRAGIAHLKPGEWLEGDGWDEGKLAERRYLKAADLDPVSPDNPVWLNHTTGHYGVANTPALRLAKISASTPDPSAGTIDRDASGVPTGVLKESAQALVGDLIPPPTADQRRAGILESIEALHREGMTAVKDPWIGRPTWDAYVGLLREGKLAERICVLWYAGTTLASARAALEEIQGQPRPPQSLGDGRLLSCGAKIFMDGSGGGRTAWLYSDWNKNSTGIDAGNRGYPSVDPEVYRQQVRLFHDAGVHVGTHAVGDRAIDWVVDTYAQVLTEKPTRGLRHSIIHANIPTDHAIETMAMLQSKYDAGYPEAQAPFTWWIGDTYAGNFGPERSQRLMPFKTYLGKGIIWGGRIGLPGYAAARAIRVVVVGGTRSLERNLRPPSVRHRTGDRHPCGAAFVHALGRQTIISRCPHGLTGSGQGCGYRGVGQKSLRHAVGGASQSALRDHAAFRRGRVRCA